MVNGIVNIRLNKINSNIFRTSVIIKPMSNNNEYKVTVSLQPADNIDYIGLLKLLIEKNRKPGERSNASEYVRKLLLKEGKKAGLL